MKKGSLAVLMLLVASLTVGAEKTGKTLYDKVKDYLGTDGLPRAEYLVGHAIVSHQGNISYERKYLIDKKEFSALFLPFTPYQQDKDTIIFLLSRGADKYLFDGELYEDKLYDGINRNEVLFEPEEELEEQVVPEGNATPGAQSQNMPGEINRMPRIEPFILPKEINKSERIGNPIYS